MLTASVTIATLGMNEKKAECQALWVYVGHGRLYLYGLDIDARKRKELNLGNMHALKNYLTLNRTIFQVSRRLSFPFPFLFFPFLSFSFLFFFPSLLSFASSDSVEPYAAGHSTPQRQRLRGG
jgi:hypothetical protein